jgi:HEPN domain-containing protein
MKTAAEEWITAARDDLETVAEIVKNPRLTHVVAFHVQQCIEKGFKAVLEKHGDDVPNIHNLITLHGRAEQYLPDETEIDLNRLDRLQSALHRRPLSRGTGAATRRETIGRRGPTVIRLRRERLSTDAATGGRK